jgi:hypothetical protein
LGRVNIYLKDTEQCISPKGEDITKAILLILDELSRQERSREEKGN